MIKSKKLIKTSKEHKSVSQPSFMLWIKCNFQIKNCQSGNKSGKQYVECEVEKSGEDWQERSIPVPNSLLEADTTTIPNFVLSQRKKWAWVSECTLDRINIQAILFCIVMLLINLWYKGMRVRKLQSQTLQSFFLLEFYSLSTCW